MKEKLIKEKGITLIALIITIIILLILAMVSIKILVDNGIITKAKEGVNKYKEEEQKEMSSLDNVVNYIGSISGSNSGNSKWVSPTPEEMASLHDGGIVASWNNGETSTQYREYNIGYGYMCDHPEECYTTLAISIETENGVYVMYSNVKSGLEYYSNNFDEDPEVDWINIKDGVWYYANWDGEFKEYIGPCPIQKEQYTEIYSESLLDKIINSFN